MPVTVNATPGSSTANSYPTLAEAKAYWATRLYSDVWDGVDDNTRNKAIIMATRVIDYTFVIRKELKVGSNGKFYTTSRGWSGAPSTATQALAWPRIGMYDANGVAIATDVIPQQLKEAVSEFAGQLMSTDTTANNDVLNQGISSLRAGPVALTFKDFFEVKTIPDAVMWLLVPSWLTDELYSNAVPALFSTI